ncbi:hypothetical protein [Acidocella sp. KAb 2-4]|uniref:hypothetical protein n=1 Tax=Acidocella sp. KAb 2-4 TaxID=2885158 RepID=UPI001D09732A|nr:hypothetical protein [Acidocella sp. KAb 2-4]MCB5945937.1 hypothetical protein [Acidocella sp. KAb 2-4]
MYKTTTKPTPNRDGRETEHLSSPNKSVEDRYRGLIALFLLIAVATFLAACGAYGLFTGDFASVRNTWMIAGPFVGMISTHYFSAKQVNA